MFMGCGLGKLAFIDWNEELVNIYFYLYAVSYYLTIFSFPFLTHRSFFLLSIMFLLYFCHLSQISVMAVTNYLFSLFHHPILNEMCNSFEANQI